ncbi:PREDICTED: uncharacterized protein LOC109585910 [Amphimedon queenslandica]|uniref:C1q domain-containing protein n=1 Tax=Amphimedon queenslandica TaxID=400682 RepID=A0A1X7TUX8_AMPQE|nr:PREDICTED: uncharacterized protein LOC109585910 [Amphimedon queenslandica]|eukprot:XP_019857613.1 PREDICTED: uncharacterized protein LOC109585910 [Amphimedon queenslandica]
MFTNVFLSMLILFAGSTWSLPLSGESKQGQNVQKRFLIFTTNPPTTEPIPTDEPDSAVNITGHSFRAHLLQDIEVNNIQSLRLTLLTTGNPSGYEIGSLVDLASGFITPPVDGLYYLQASVQLRVTSDHFNCSDRITVAFCSGHCESATSDNVWLYYTSQILTGDMTVVASGILQLKANQRVTVHLLLPKHLKIKLKSSSTVSGTLIV